MVGKDVKGPWKREGKFKFTFEVSWLVRRSCRFELIFFLLSLSSSLPLSPCFYLSILPIRQHSSAPPTAAPPSNKWKRTTILSPIRPVTGAIVRLSSVLRHTTTM